MNSIKGNISSAQGIFYALFEMSNKSTYYIYLYNICISIVGYIDS